jgi:hypothetical protein
VKRRQKVE